MLAGRINHHALNVAAWLWVRSLRTQHRPDRPWMRRLSRLAQRLACATHRDRLSYCCEEHRAVMGDES